MSRAPAHDQAPNARPDPIDSKAARANEARPAPFGARQGRTILPGAPLAPSSVWQELQSPVVCGVVIEIDLPLYVTVAVNGVTSAFDELKLPTVLGVSVVVVLLASVMTTATPVTSAPSQRSGSCSVG